MYQVLRSSASMVYFLYKVHNMFFCFFLKFVEHLILGDSVDVLFMIELVQYLDCFYFSLLKTQMHDHLIRIDSSDEAILI